tara:strand:+ start:1279 stop:2229 length:951 start_codon:yes stop_codon:yes gene_type:complete
MNKIKRLIKFIKISYFDFNKKESLRSKILYYILLNKINKKIAFAIYKIFNYENIFKNEFQFKNLLKKLYLTDEQLTNHGLEFHYMNNKSAKSKTQEAKELLSNGYHDFSNSLNLDIDFINSFKLNLYNLKGFNSQIPLSSDLKKINISEKYNYFSFDPSEPSLKIFYKKILNNKKLKIIIDDYLGYRAKLYSINTMIITKSTNFHNVTNLHRDYDDDNFLTLFVYWTNTEKNNGSIYFIPGTHLDKSSDTNNGLYLEGYAGSSFLLNTFALHSGNKKIQSDRIVTWFRFGRRTNLAHYVDKGYLHNEYYDELYQDL